MANLNNRSFKPFRKNIIQPKQKSRKGYYYNPKLKRFKKKKPRIHFRLQLVMKKRNPDKKRYFAFLLRTKNNVFITITDVRGQVVVSQSAGKCKITTKKKKRSWDTLKSVSESAAKVARLKNIRYIYKLFLTTTYMKNARIIFNAFKKVGLRTLQTFIVRSRPHGLPMRKRKLKRL